MKSTKDFKDYQIILLVVISVMINYIGKDIATVNNLPVWLDSVGTILSAYYLGPVCGAIVGATVNIMYGLKDSVVFAYMIVNILTGVIVGIASVKNRFKNIFQVITVGSLVAILSTLFSAPLNYFLYHGYTGNIWGDGIVELFKGWRFPNAICYFIGEFYVDFLDKAISVFLIFLITIIVRNRREFKAKKNMAIILLVVLTASLNTVVYAVDLKDNVTNEDNIAIDTEDTADSIDYNSYIQTVYGSLNGILGGEANDIAATKDGLLWIGTYGGLYRYNGTEFKRMEEFASVKNVNCIFVDEEGRMWLGSNDDGLSICINQEIYNVIDKRDGLPSNSVRSIAFSSDGYYYVGTTDALCVITLSSGIKINKTIDEIVYAKSISTDKLNNAAIVTDLGELFLLNDANVTDKISVDDSLEYKYTSCDFDEDGRLYVGTSTNIIECFEIQNGKLVKLGNTDCGNLKDFNAINCDESGRIFACSNFGVGYIYKNKFIEINTNSFNSSIGNMTIDYQGNLWFTSSRQGLLKLCNSPCVEMYSEAGLDTKVVNSVVEWKNRIYFGTDKGLDVIDAKTRNIVDDPICQVVSESRIRSVVVDSRNHLWICTFGDGIYEVEANGEYKVYTEQEGAMGNKHRICIELSDGVSAISGDLGISFIKDGKIIKTLGKEEGLTNPKILTLTELSNGQIVAGSDGAGIFIIDNYKVIDNINREKGLGSDIILRTVKIDEGLLVVTSNSISYIDNDNNVKELKSFPYFNNYDIIEKNDKFWVLSGAGIYIVDRESLLNDKITEYELLDIKLGLRGVITANSWNYVDADNNLYVCCDTGVNKINMDKYDDSLFKSYRMSVKSINVDGNVKQLTIGESVSIPRGSSKLTIFPEIINYSITDPYVMYYLEGFDKRRTIIPQSELSSVVYTNLPSGKYTFHLAVMDGKKENVIEELTYVIDKEKEIQDNAWFLVYTTIVFGMIIAWFTWFIARTQVQKTLNFQKKELELIKNQLKMGNETVLAIARTVDAKDENTSQHSFRVSEYSVLIAKKLGFDEEQCENLRKTALLHDIGKIGIPDKVLNKPAKLTDEEYQIMKSHVVRGGEILKDFTLIDHVSDGALYHHERYDGKGYAHGLKGEEIPLNARIIGIADAFDAMTANRVYRKKLDFEYVIEELKKGRGTQFDPQLVDIMLTLIDDGDIDVNSLYKEVTE